MYVKQSVHMEATVNEAAIPQALILLLATGAGLSVASLYYSQPILSLLGHDIKASNQLVGWIPTLTQLGYALGILLLTPLGDRYDRRQIILVKAGTLTLSLLLSGLAPGIAGLLAASLAVGLTATLAQDIVPAAATIAPETQRGRTVGFVMTGLLLGILLSRVFSGFIAEQLGWRFVFTGASVSMGLIGIVLWRGLPHFKPGTNLKYRTLIVSMIQLWRNHSTLRKAAWSQGFLSIGFSAFWSTLAIMLHGAPFHLGSSVAGAFGLAGAAGALAAPLAGHLADRRGPELVTRIGAGLTAVSFAAMWSAPFLSPHAQLIVIAVSTIGFDFGIQATLVAHQTIVYSIDLGSRSRLNALLFTGMFTGMSVGAALGSLAFDQWGWLGVVILATTSSICALVIRMRS